MFREIPEFLVLHLVYTGLSLVRCRRDIQAPRKEKKIKAVKPTNYPRSVSYWTTETSGLCESLFPRRLRRFAGVAFRRRSGNFPATRRRPGLAWIGMEFF